MSWFYKKPIPNYISNPKNDEFRVLEVKDESYELNIST